MAKSKKPKKDEKIDADTEPDTDGADEEIGDDDDDFGVDELDGDFDDDSEDLDGEALLDDDDFDDEPEEEIARPAKKRTSHRRSGRSCTRRPRQSR